MDNVVIQRNAFAFCRYSVAILVWLALILRSVPLLVLVFVILALSAILKVRRAPMVWLWTQTVGRVIESPDVVLDANAMRAAHTAGAVLAFTALVLVYVFAPIGWATVAVLAVLKTISALGWCPAYKLYGCLTSGGG